MFTLTINSLPADYAPAYTLPLGEAIRIDSHYETILRRLEQHLPAGREFKAVYAHPGTSHYTLYGPDTLVVVLNRPAA